MIEFKPMKKALLAFFVLTTLAVFIAAQPGNRSGQVSVACGGCTNSIAIGTLACGGCTNAVSVDALACGGCTNIVSGDALACGGCTNVVPATALACRPFHLL